MNENLSFAGLSPQEQQVLQLSMAGLADKEAAARLGLSLDTVKTYWKRIRQKVGGQTRPEIIALLIEKGANVALEEVRVWNKRLTEAVEASFDRIAICSPLFDSDGSIVDYRLTHCNSGFAAFLDRPNQDVTGMNLFEGLTAVEASALFGLMKGISEPRNASSEAVVSTLDMGSDRTVQVRIVPVPDGVVLALKDAT